MTDPTLEHSWPSTVAQARVVQEDLRDRMVRRDETGPLERVAGVDAAFEKGGDVIRAAAVVLDLSDLEPSRPLDQSVVRRPTPFPYVPGYLSFRELPAVLDALKHLDEDPDLILCDAHGYAHPRRFGLACHLGVLLDVPTIGVAKSRLVGEHERPGRERGDRTPLVDDGEVIGAVVRTRTGVKPVFVSVGHRISLEHAVDLTLRCTPRYRLAEPIRWADRLASR